ncbi:MFS18 protein-like [Oryza brachyantha]|uniref:MFS18 protein-like n=1 Tax=Oryza brachyantha TaxID=4533 RepID=UPI001ADB6711|nr:MFS18 protein-like [Oryza brachyantha]
MEKSSKMMAVAAVLVLAVAAGAAEARNIKTAEESKDTVVQPTTFPPFDRFGSAVPAFGGMPGGSSIPGFSLPGSTPGFGGIGSMPIFGGLGGSPGLGGGMPGSPAAASTASVDKQAKKP